MFVLRPTKLLFGNCSLLRSDHDAFALCRCCHGKVKITEVYADHMFRSFITLSFEAL